MKKGCDIGLKFSRAFRLKECLLGFVFVAMMPFCGLGEEPAFLIVPVDQVETAKNTVTCTVFQSGDDSYLYTAGDGNKIEVFRIAHEGALRWISSQVVSGGRNGVRGIVVDRVAGKNFLFAGLKGADAVEVFEIADDGTLRSVYVERDSEATHLGIVITLQVVHMESASYLFVGGLEKTPGLSSFKIMATGQLQHIQSMADTDEIFSDGIIGMSIHRIDGETYLFTGGFQDNGLSSFRVFEDGHFSNISNVGDDDRRFLNGTYPVISATKSDRHYVVVGHRHHIYYKPTAWIKDLDSYFYHGDAVSVFRVNEQGQLQQRSVFKGDAANLIQGQTRLHCLPLDDKYDLIAVATRDDQSIQLCLLSDTGRLISAGNLKTGFSIYYGLCGAQIEDQLFLFAGSVNGSELVSYRLDQE